MDSPGTSRETFDDFLNRKMNYLSKLSAEYENLLTTTVAPYNDPETEMRILHNRYLKLKAEKQVLEHLEPAELPTDPEFLYEWVKYKLLQSKNEDEKKLEECKKQKQILAAELSLLENQNKSHSEEQIDDLLEKEKERSEIIQQLQRKVVKRLRRLARFHMQSDSEDVLPDESSATKSKKSFYKVLKEFVLELQDRSPGTNQDRDGVVVVNETFPSEHIELLEECGVIQWLTKPHTMRLTPMDQD